MKKILIIEDDFYISKLYNRTFTLSGFQVDTAVSGKEALEKAKANTYDVMLLDVMLGDMTGLEVLQTFRGPDHPAKATPVFLSTNRGEDEIIKRGFELGIEGYFFKSQYVPQDIVTEVNAFFTRQEQAALTTSPPSPAPNAQQAPTPAPAVSQTTGATPAPIVAPPAVAPAVATGAAAAVAPPAAVPIVAPAPVPPTPIAPIVSPAPIPPVATPTAAPIPKQ